MAICSRCGNNAPDGTMMCPVCGTPFPPMPQAAPPPVQQGAVPPIPSAITQGQSGVEIVSQPIPVPNVPSIPNVPDVKAMATGAAQQAATQVLRQFTGAVDVMAPQAQGETVLSTWQAPTGLSSAAQMGVSAVKTATKGKYAWMWFLIPVITILAWVITQLTK